MNAKDVYKAIRDAYHEGFHDGGGVGTEWPRMYHESDARQAAEALLGHGLEIKQARRGKATK